MCTSSSAAFAWAIAIVRLLNGVMFVIFGVYDVIWPDAATSSTTVDLR